MSEPKRMGRPRKAPEKGPRQNYTFRMHDQTRELVYAAAEANGRSLSEEIEARIEASFAEDRMRAIAREEIEKREAERKPDLQALLDRQKAVVGELMQQGGQVLSGRAMSLDLGQGLSSYRKS